MEKGREGGEGRGKREKSIGGGGGRVIGRSAGFQDND